MGGAAGTLIRGPRATEGPESFGGARELRRGPRASEGPESFGGAHYCRIIGVFVAKKHLTRTHFFFLELDLT